MTRAASAQKQPEVQRVKMEQETVESVGIIVPTLNDGYGSK